LLEAAVINKDEKTKLELLKKGYDSLKNYKVQFHDENSIELNTELWYKYGVQYYQFNNPVNYKQALICSDNCIKTFVQSEISKMSNNRLKWYAVGFLLFGDCLFKLVDTKKQERVSQIKLYFESIEKYQKAAQLAEKCKEYYTILQSLKAFYLSVIQIIDQQQNRVELVPYFSNFHDILISNKVQVLFSDPDFLLLFYSMFCTCINEKKDWSLGEKVISEAVKYIPDNYKSFLNEHRLFYMSKQGKSFLQSLTGSDEKDVVSKAKLYVKLARSSANKVDQFNAYSKAIELLKNDDNVVVTDIMFEMATWLYKNNHPIEDVEEQLLQATDVLLEIEPIFDEEDNLEDDMTLVKY
jgi:tetratricopeptide (TPR) repeat protein